MKQYTMTVSLYNENSCNGCPLLFTGASGLVVFCPAAMKQITALTRPAVCPLKEENKCIFPAPETSQSDHEIQLRAQRDEARALVSDVATHRNYDFVCTTNCRSAVKKWIEET